MKDKSKGMDTKLKVNLLALGIFGLILFPCHRDRIDSQVVPLLFSVIRGSRGNISTMVLAETMRTCVHASTNQHTHIKGCTQFLTLWIHNHFPTEEDQRRNDKYERTTWNTEADLINR